jgi:hypothetical protein
VKAEETLSWLVFLKAEEWSLFEIFWKAEG